MQPAHAAHKQCSNCQQPAPASARRCARCGYFYRLPRKPASPLVWVPCLLLALAFAGILFAQFGADARRRGTEMAAAQVAASAVRPGMTKAQVTAALGMPHSKSSDAMRVGFETWIFDVAGGGSVIVSFWLGSVQRVYAAAG